jgi:hypothetical protein
MQLRLGSAVVSTAVFGVSPKTSAPYEYSPNGESSRASDWLAGRQPERPRRFALPTASLRLSPTNCLPSEVAGAPGRGNSPAALMPNPLQQPSTKATLPRCFPPKPAAARPAFTHSLIQTSPVPERSPKLKGLGALRYKQRQNCIRSPGQGTRPTAGGCRPRALTGGAHMRNYLSRKV